MPEPADPQFFPFAGVEPDQPRVNGVEHEPPPDDDGWMPTDDDDPFAPPATAEQAPQRKPAPPNPIGCRWVSVADAGWLTTEPPRQEWLLTRADGMGWAGVLPRGRVGLITGAGGIAKTMTMIQLAIAIASGRPWLGSFGVGDPGHVCLFLGEELGAEVHRRLWRIAAAMELDLTARQEIAARIHIVPLHGVDVAFLRSPGAGIIELTPIAAQIRTALDSRGVDWSAVVLDPLARFAGAGAENNNEIATRFVGLAEQLTDARGNPTVLVAHHASKSSLRAGEADVRGVTGLHDGARWVATLDEIEDDDGQKLVRMRNAKSNYSPKFPDVFLTRGDYGVLVPADRVAVEQIIRPDPAKKQDKKDATMRERAERDAEAAAAILGAKPGIGVREYRGQMQVQAGVGRERADAALLALGGRVVRTDGPGRRVQLVLAEVTP